MHFPLPPQYDCPIHGAYWARPAGFAIRLATIQARVTTATKSSLQMIPLWSMTDPLSIVPLSPFASL